MEEQNNMWYWTTFQKYVYVFRFIRINGDDPRIQNGPTIWSQLQKIQMFSKWIHLCERVDQFWMWTTWGRMIQFSKFGDPNKSSSLSKKINNKNIMFWRLTVRHNTPSGEDVSPLYPELTRHLFKRNQRQRRHKRPGTKRRHRWTTSNVDINTHTVHCDTRTKKSLTSQPHKEHVDGWICANQIWL